MDSIEAALANLALQESPNYAETARKFNVNRCTLSRRHRGITTSVKEGRQSRSILSSQQQKALISYINKLTERGIPPTNAMIRVFAYNISGNRPGKNWSYSFVQTHKDVLQSKVLQGADLDRKKADNAYQYQLYFKLVSALIIPRFRANIR